MMLDKGGSVEEEEVGKRSRRSKIGELSGGNDKIGSHKIGSDRTGGRIEEEIKEKGKYERPN